MTNRIKRHLLALLLDPLPPMREWYRASGDCVCDRCLCEFRMHPLDRETHDVVLCNGDRVHL